MYKTKGPEGVITASTGTYNHCVSSNTYRNNVYPAAGTGILSPTSVSAQLNEDFNKPESYSCINYRAPEREVSHYDRVGAIFDKDSLQVKKYPSISNSSSRENLPTLSINENPHGRPSK